MSHKYFVWNDLNKQKINKFLFTYCFFYNGYINFVCKGFIIVENEIYFKRVLF
jgi:hypothetical protein